VKAVPTIAIKAPPKFSPSRSAPFEFFGAVVDAVLLPEMELVVAAVVKVDCTDDDMVGVADSTVVVVLAAAPIVVENDDITEVVLETVLVEEALLVEASEETPPLYAGLPMPNW